MNVMKWDECDEVRWMWWLWWMWWCVSLFLISLTGLSWTFAFLLQAVHAVPMDVIRPFSDKWFHLWSFMSDSQASVAVYRHWPYVMFYVMIRGDLRPFTCDYWQISAFQLRTRRQQIICDFLLRKEFISCWHDHAHCVLNIQVKYRGTITGIRSS
jgi:hypothetical protein